MDEGKYQCRLSLLCPTCSSDLFLFDDENEAAPVVCATCGRQTTRDELIRDNSENIELHVADMGREVMADATRELNRTLRDAFRGNKNIRFR